MKKILTIIAFSALSLMAAEQQDIAYLGTLSTNKCKDSCSYSNYTKNDKLIAVIDGKRYNIEAKNLSDTKLEVALGHDDVTFTGIIKGDTILASGVERIPDKIGFLGLQSCVTNGSFTDCNLKQYHDGDQVVAIIEGKTYLLDKQAVSQTKIDHAIMQSNVGFFGKIEGNTFKLENMIYEGSAKSFFKGCV